MIATYRLQLHPDFNFDDARKLLPYLADLGVSHLYLSPITEARDGSTHGYDVVDHNTIREELGGDEGFEQLRREAVERGLGLIIDFVPNHAGVGPQNATWQEMLCYGPHAESARHFDVDWLPLKPELREKVLLPFLGAKYGDVLDDGEITLAFEKGRFYAAYYENRFALNPATYAPILKAIAKQVQDSSISDEIIDIADAFDSVDRSNRAVCERLRKQMADTLADILPTIQLDDLLEVSSLHALLEKQYWRLAFWKTAGSEINYRRFFTINELVALRMEDPAVFRTTHRLISDLVQRDGVDGLRIDHVDGLYDPHDYLERLANLGGGHIWVEKILAHGETMPDAWPIEGATGYTFMNDAMGVLLQDESEETLNRIYRRYVESTTSFEDEALSAKIEIMQQSLTSERSRLAYELDRISEKDYHYRDFTLESLQNALTHIIACFERYRTYLPYGDEETHEMIRELIHRARQLPGAEEPSVYDFIGDVLTDAIPEELNETRRAWIGRLQQYTAPVAAKGVEDTAFYRYYRLVALNEVGGEPGQFGTTDHAFHSRCQFRASRYPRHLLATATHDHKRGEDTRMRLLAIAEMTDKWENTVSTLDNIAEPYCTDHAPARTDLYLFFQMLVALLADADHETLTTRLSDYMTKAAREAKIHTTWANPDESYESALTEVVEGVLHDPQLDEIAPFTESLANLGYRNTISQMLLKLTTPGIPDFYQGSELFDLSMVDPDNRRPVDYERRQSLLREINPTREQPSADQLNYWLGSCDERLKLFVIARLLQARKNNEKLYTSGTHQKLEVTGENADQWLAFRRTLEDESLIVIVPRYFRNDHDEQPASIELPNAEESWLCELTGAEHSEELSLNTLDFPWAVLHSTTTS